MEGSGGMTNLLSAVVCTWEEVEEDGEEAWPGAKLVFVTSEMAFGVLFTVEVLDCEI